MRLWKTYLNYITLTNWKSAADHLSTFAELLGEFSGFLLLWMLYHKKNKCKFSNFLNLTITTHICFAIGYILSSYLFFCLSLSVTSKLSLEIVYLENVTSDFKFNFDFLDDNSTNMFDFGSTIKISRVFWISGARHDKAIHFGLQESFKRVSRTFISIFILVYEVKITKTSRICETGIYKG